MSKHELIKELLELAQTTKEADEILTKYTGYQHTHEKKAFLAGMFDVEIVSRSIGDDVTEEQMLHDDYLAILATVIDLKWR